MVKELSDIIHEQVWWLLLAQPRKKDFHFDSPCCSTHSQVGLWLSFWSKSLRFNVLSLFRPLWVCYKIKTDSVWTKLFFKTFMQLNNIKHQEWEPYFRFNSKKEVKMLELLCKILKDSPVGPAVKQPSAPGGWIPAFLFWGKCDSGGLTFKPEAEELFQYNCWLGWYCFSSNTKTKMFHFVFCVLQSSETWGFDCCKSVFCF